MLTATVLQYHKNSQLHNIKFLKNICIMNICSLYLQRTIANYAAFQDTKKIRKPA